MNRNISSTPCFNARRFLLALALLAPLVANSQTLIFQSAQKAPAPDSPVPAALPEVSGAPDVPMVAAPVSRNIYTAPSVNTELLSMIEQLQREVQELRGTVEVQANEIRILKRNAKARYVDLDQRILTLS